MRYIVSCHVATKELCTLNKVFKVTLPTLVAPVYPCDKKHGNYFFFPRPLDLPLVKPPVVSITYAPPCLIIIFVIRYLFRFLYLFRRRFFLSGDL